MAMMYYLKVTNVAVSHRDETIDTVISCKYSHVTARHTHFYRDGIWIKGDLNRLECHLVILCGLICHTFNSAKDPSLGDAWFTRHGETVVSDASHFL